MSNKSVGVFVDLAKLYHAVTLTNKMSRIQYNLYLEGAKRDYELHRAYAYGVQIDGEAESFADVLAGLGYDVKYKRAKRVRNPYKPSEFIPSIRETPSNLDIALDVFKNLDYMDVVVLGTNDTEIVPLIEFLKERGIRVEIYSYNIPKELRMVADRCIEIDDSIIEAKSVEESETT